MPFTRNDIAAVDVALASTGLSLKLRDRVIDALRSDGQADRPFDLLETPLLENRIELPALADIEIVPSGRAWVNPAAVRAIGPPVDRPHLGDDDVVSRPLYLADGVQLAIADTTANLIALGVPITEGDPR